MLNRENKIVIDEFLLEHLHEKADFDAEEISLFDCGDKDLNEYFRLDAYSYKKELLAETYSFQLTENATNGFYHPIAFVSLLNDQLAVTKEDKKQSHWKKLFRKIPNRKRLFKTYPAVKIGRLGVGKDYQRSHIGTSLLNVLKQMFVTNNRTGCKFLTVDAYSNAVQFYEKNGFYFYNDEDQNEDTRIMWYDLKNNL